MKNYAWPFIDKKCSAYVETCLTFIQSTGNQNTGKSLKLLEAVDCRNFSGSWGLNVVYFLINTLGSMTL